MGKFLLYWVFALIFCSCSDEPIRELTISSFSPASDGPGIEIEIVGKGFGNEASGVLIDFSGTTASVLSVSDTLVVTEVPVDATSGPISIQVGEQRVSSTAVFEVLTGIWTKKEDIPFGRGIAAAVDFTISGTGYLGTGIDNGRIFDAFWKYTPSTNQWSDVPVIPGGGRWFSSGFALDGQAFVGPGRIDNETEISPTFFFVSIPHRKAGIR